MMLLFVSQDINAQKMDTTFMYALLDTTHKMEVVHHVQLIKDVYRVDIKCNLAHLLKHSLLLGTQYVE